MCDIIQQLSKCDKLLVLNNTIVGRHIIPVNKISVRTNNKIEVTINPWNNSDHDYLNSYLTIDCAKETDTYKQFISTQQVGGQPTFMVYLIKGIDKLDTPAQKMQYILQVKNDILLNLAEELSLDTIDGILVR